MFILSTCLSISKINVLVSIAFHSGGFLKKKKKKRGNNKPQF